MVLVDSDLDAVTLLAHVLRNAGHDVHTFELGIDVVEECARLRPDAVVMDVSLSDMSGFDIARALRRDPRVRNVRLVALTGYAENAYRERATSAGFDAFVVKPASMKTISTAIAGTSEDSAEQSE